MLGAYRSNRHKSIVTGQNTLSAFADEVSEAKPISKEVWTALQKASTLEVVQFLFADNVDRRVVSVDRWKAQGIRGVVVRSFTHNGEELVHTRTLTYSVEKSVERSTEARAVGHPRRIIGKEECTFQESSDQPGSTLTVYTNGTTLEWEDATHYDGLVVPLHVLTKMRTEAGVEAGAWQGRGVKVGEKAWDVLLAWKKESEKQKTGTV